MKKILCINPGSTSVKYTLFEESKRLFDGEFKRLKGRDQSLSVILKTLKRHHHIISFADIAVCGIRVVHGGNIFSKPTVITPRNELSLRKLSDLAPLHNPPALDVIDQVQATLPKAKIVAVFDTAFHQTLSPEAFTYALPRALSAELGIRRYGFHGIASQSALRQLKKKLKRLPARIIHCHLGGGCTVTAIKNGRSADTSMGMTPLGGLVMATRSGDIDPGLFEFIARQKKWSADRITAMLNHESGLLGLTGLSDVKTIVERARRGDPSCKLAMDVFLGRLVKYIYAYASVLQGIDLIVFSGGIGENSAWVRAQTMKRLKPLGKIPLEVVHVDENEEIRRQVITALLSR